MLKAKYCWIDVDWLFSNINLVWLFRDLKLSLCIVFTKASLQIFYWQSEKWNLRKDKHLLHSDVCL